MHENVLKRFLNFKKRFFKFSYVYNLTGVYHTFLLCYCFYYILSKFLTEYKNKTLNKNVTLTIKQEQI